MSSLADRRSEIAASLVPRESVSEVWPHVAPHLDEAMKIGGDYTLKDARAALADGFWRLWIAARPGVLVAAAVSEVMPYPRRTVLHIHAAGGSELAGVEALWPLVREYARGQECAAVRWHGRPGWVRGRHLSGRTARVIATVAEMEV